MVFILFYWGKHYSFPHKTLSIAITFFLMGFFPSKIIVVDFFLLTKKLNHVGKSLCLFSQNTVDCYKSFCSVSKFFLSPTQLFFTLWNIGSIIHLVSITYLALIHNYNTIKYIFFINPWQRADISSHLPCKWPHQPQNWSLLLYKNTHKSKNKNKN